MLKGFHGEVMLVSLLLSLCQMQTYLGEVNNYVSDRKGKHIDRRFSPWMIPLRVNLL